MQKKKKQEKKKEKNAALDKSAATQLQKLFCVRVVELRLDILGLSEGGRARCWFFFGASSLVIP